MIGRTLAHYRIVEELGGGGMGMVYRAQDTRLGRDVALKVLAIGRAVTQADRNRFLGEARAAAALRHPNICTIYDVGDEGDLSYIAMSYIEGRSLQEIIDDGPVDVDRALDIASQVAGALQAAHERSIVHRDIKASNIVVDAGGRATILDFGVAKLAGHITDTGAPRAVGTVAYMSPEQAGGEAVDHRTDLWSLGVCLFQMITGELPFQGAHDSVVIYQIINRDPPWLDGRDTPTPVARIIHKAMQKRPEMRYQLAEEMMVDLELARRELLSTAGHPAPSIAVLPFNNISADPDQDYFCDGMAEEIINSLAHVEGLRVAARTSSFAFRGRELDVREVGQRLGVDTIMEGSVQKSGGRLRITAQLVSVRDGYHMWSERYDREMEDIFGIQDEIARHIVDALEVTLTERELSAIAKVPTRDMTAYDFYIRGQQYYHRLDKKGLEYARNLFTSAIIHDPGYALAYCGLANSYSMIYTFHDRDATNIENALTASTKALEIDDDLAEAHASHGLAASLDNRNLDADREFLRAIEIAPKLFEVYYFWGRACRARGDLAKAAELFEKAADLRPEDYEAPLLAADTLRGLDRREEQERWFRRGREVADRYVELHPTEARAWYLGAHAYLELGDRDRALEWNQRAMEMAPRDPATLYNAACLFAVMGDTDRCFQCLDTAVEHGFGNRAWLEHDPDLDRIRQDPRYEPLLERLV